MSIEDLYRQNCKQPEKHADIWEHLPTLKFYAEHAKHITEFGTRSGNSTSAFLLGLAKHGGEMVSYDIDQIPFIAPPIANVTWAFHKQDIKLLAQIAPTDILFIDDYHDYNHVVWELKTFSPSVSKYMILHDTSSTWAGGDRIWKARDKFLSETPAWFMSSHYENCNGLSILERK